MSATTGPEEASGILRRRTIAAVVIGASAGGLDAISMLLSALRADTSFAIVCVLHVAPDGANLIPALLGRRCRLPVKEAESTERLSAGRVYVAPADYHLSIEPDGSFALSVDEPVLFSRPSIDVLFESAAEAYGRHLLGMLLTGANSDGAAGIARIKECGGLTAVQDPSTAEFPEMPSAAIARSRPDLRMALPLLAALLGGLGEAPREAR